MTPGTLRIGTYFVNPPFEYVSDGQRVGFEVDLMNEIAAIRDELKNGPDPTKRAALVKRLNEKSLTLDLALERYKRKR
jgi:ABC-type amino acid transport substrate-binding protein